MDWYPTPSYLVKRKAILEALATLDKRDFLEVGCGAGDLLRVLEKKGYEGLGIDYSPEVIDFAAQGLSGKVSCMGSDLDDINGEYGIVIASEVMEHHKEDVRFLKKLVERTKPDGYVIITVPAHMKKWGANDDFCGHIRRYEREELTRKVIESGLEPKFIYSYGVPVYNIMKPFYDRGIAKQLEGDDYQESRTKKSGGMWLFIEMKLLFHLLFNNITMFPFYFLQRIFYKTDLGNGYIILAKKV